MREPFTKLYVHVVWATWDRRPLITQEVEAIVYPTLQAEARKAGGEALAIGGVEDHVHVLLRLPTTIAVAELVKRLKGVSSHVVTDRPNAPDFFKWQGAYGAFSVSRWDVRRVQAYVQRQPEHHTEGSLSAALERITTS